MKLLFDENLSYKSPARIQDIFPGSVHVAHAEYKSASDHSSARYAVAYDYVVVTKDHDLQEIALTTQPDLKVVLLQVGNISAENVDRLIRRHTQEIVALGSDSGLRILIVEENKR